MDNPTAPMSSFVKLLVRELGRSRAFYEALGFQVLHQDNLFLHLRWAPGADLYLVETPPGFSLPERPGAGVLVCYTAIEVELAELARRAKEAGAVVEGPQATPWFTEELWVTDPDGYRLDFARPA